MSVWQRRFATSAVGSMNDNQSVRQLNERERAQQATIQEFERVHQQAVSGLLMLDEFLDKLVQLRERTPRLQTGDIDIITGLRV